MQMAPQLFNKYFFVLYLLFLTLEKTSKINETLCAIWYHLYNLKNLKNTSGGVTLLVKLQAKACYLTESNTLP